MEMVAVVGDVERQKAKETVLQEFVRFSWGVSRGISSAAEAEGRSLVSRMVQAKKVTPEQGDRLMATLLSKMAASKQVFESRVDASVKRAMQKVQTLTEAEVTRLTQQVSGVEKRLEKLTTKQGK